VDFRGPQESRACLVHRGVLDLKEPLELVALRGQQGMLVLQARQVL
jgi:hypothetical protein